MRWKGREQSSHVEDRRGMSGRKMVAGGTVGTLVLLLLVWLLGGDPSQVMSSLSPENESVELPAAEQGPFADELAQFAAVVLKDTEDVWRILFKEQGMNYSEPVLVLYSGSVQSACGFSSSATGPFYCPADEKLYIDLEFMQSLQQRLSAQGDFAMAYIIAHEVGHHVQNLLGTTDKLHRLRQQLSETEYNPYSVKLELQADFLAGVWAHHAQRTKNILEPGDIEEAIRASGAVGDDRIQMQQQGYVVPDAFTHGTSEQRMEWFTRGYESGELADGDTFSMID